MYQREKYMYICKNLLHLIPNYRLTASINMRFYFPTFLLFIFIFFFFHRVSHNWDVDKKRFCRD